MVGDKGATLALGDRGGGGHRVRGALCDEGGVEEDRRWGMRAEGDERAG